MARVEMKKDGLISFGHDDKNQGGSVSKHHNVIAPAL